MEKLRKHGIKMSKIRNILKKIPIAGSVLQAVVRGNRRRKVCRYNRVIQERLKRKKEAGEPIHVVFVCHRPAVWESLHSVYDCIKEDPAFRVSLVAIPNKKQLPELGLNHEQYESEGAEEFWKNEGCIAGYNYETGEWLDLESLEPDYVFFQQPYNSCRPPQYHSRVVSRYARICYVSYFGVFYIDDIYDECAPLDYLGDLSFFFTQNPMDTRYIKQRLMLAAPHSCKVVNTGFPRYDCVEDYRVQKSDIWQKQDSFKMVWTPRWTTNEGNCHFFDYKDRIVEYCKADPGVELVFRPHPQAFKEWNATGELPEEEAKIYKQNFRNSNMHLDDSNNYYPMLYGSDCLITDRSTILLDYFCTGKPIIYCMSRDLHDKIFPELMEGMYCVNTWEEVQKVLCDLRQGIDRLETVRKQIVEKNFVTKGQTAGQKIAEEIKRDTQE